MILSLTILSLGCILAYTLAVCLKFKGIPYSVSDTFYSLEHKWWFTVTMYVSSLLLAPAAFECSSDTNAFLVFLFTFGQLLVGTAPHFRGYQRTLHITGAVLLLFGTQIWIGLGCPWILLSWAAYLIATAVIVVMRHKDTLYNSIVATKPIFWIEVVAFVNLYVYLGIKLYNYD